MPSLCKKSKNIFQSSEGSLVDTSSFAADCPIDINSSAGRQSTSGQRLAAARPNRPTPPISRCCTACPPPIRLRRTPLPAAQRPRPQALRHRAGRADRADRQHRAEARRGDARLLSRRLDPRRLRHAAEGMDGRPDQASSRIISTR